MTTQEKLARAAAELNAGRAESARALLDSVLAKTPRNAVALYLMGGACKVAGDLLEAERFYRQALGIDDRQPQIHNSLGVVLDKLGRLPEARDAFFRATSLQPGYYEAWLNAGRVSVRLRSSSDASAAFEKAISLKPAAAAIFGLGNARMLAGDPVQAATLFERALSINPQYPGAQRRLADALYDAGECDEALSLLTRLSSAEPDDASLYRDIAKAQYQLGNDEAALASFEKAVAIAPGEAQFHRDLNQCLFMLEKDDRFLRSYGDPISADPHNVSLILGFSELAIASGRAEEALPVVDAALKENLDPGALNDCRGQLLTALDRIDDAALAYDSALNTAPENYGFLHNRGVSSLRMGAFEDALAYLEKAYNLAPDDQMVLADYTTALQAAKDERWKKFLDTDRFVQKRQIEVPPGFSTLAEFNATLQEELMRLHHAQREPIDQSLRGGTQLELSQLVHSNRLIAALVKSFSTSIEGFIAELTGSSDEPFIRNIPSSVEYAGIWSVCLRSGGHHVSHAHPEGWLSSCYYVSLPSVMSDTSDAGYIKFGEPPFACPGAELDRITVKPAEGALVLFPSYFWHGTVPFDDNEPRLTVAFDIRPKR